MNSHRYVCLPELYNVIFRGFFLYHISHRKDVTTLCDWLVKTNAFGTTRTQINHDGVDLDYFKKMQSPRSHVFAHRS